MNKKPYDIGDEVILIAHFVDRNGTPYNPSVVTGSIKNPLGVVSAIVFTNTGTVGHYEAAYSPLLEGKYWWRCAATAGVNAADERAFFVDERKVV